MAQINPSLPTVGQPDATEEPKVLTALQAIIAVINGNLDTANLAGSVVDGYLKLATAANRKIAFGASDINFPGAATSDVATVPHGLGVVPAVVLALAGAPSNNITDAVILNTLTTPAWSTTNFTIRGRTASGAVVGPGPVKVYWLAIG